MRQYCYRIIAIVAIMTMLLCTGCRDTSFSPYKHMREIVMQTKQSEFEAQKDFLLSHVSDKLKVQLASDLNGSIIDPKYSIREANAWSETTDSTTHILAEYEVTTSSDMYYKIAYFTYEDDVLVDYQYTKIQTSMFS